MYVTPLSNELLVLELTGYACMVCIDPTTEIPTTSVPTCAPGQFQCISDLSCVEPEKLCDTRSDCSDGSDEDSPDPCSTITMLVAMFLFVLMSLFF